ncbi:MAG: CRISPR-associated ring nuclease Crn3/Csx3 [Saprospiraceae bacterium]|nr:CRISPR-associated ring nuclease Crn3/Csx3 [Saprospiraceae bacterium]
MINTPPKISFSVQREQEYTLLEIALANPIEPNDIHHMQNLPDLVNENRASLGVILSGRGPIWLYGYLIHHYHPCMWVAVFDPKLNGAVVVQSHSEKYNAADVIPI